MFRWIRYGLCSCSYEAKKEEEEEIREVNYALRQCGCELVKDGMIQDNLPKIISQPLISEKEYTTALTKEYLEIKTE